MSNRHSYLMIKKHQQVTTIQYRSPGHIIFRFNVKYYYLIIKGNFSYVCITRNFFPDVANNFT